MQIITRPAPLAGTSASAPSGIDRPNVDFWFGVPDGLTLTPHHRNASLTPRESAVLALIMDGCSSKVAADILNISPRTVEFHRANIMQKMDAKNIADLVRIVLESGSDPDQRA